MAQKRRYTFIFKPGFRLCTTSCGRWSSFASNDRTTPLGMNRRYRWYVIKCVMLTHAFSLWPARTSASESATKHGGTEWDWTHNGTRQCRPRRRGRAVARCTPVGSHRHMLPRGIERCKPARQGLAVVYMSNERGPCSG